MNGSRFRPAWLHASALLLCLGCGSPTSKNPESAPEEPPVERGFGTGQVEIVRRGDDRSVEWSVQAQKADLLDAGPGKLGGLLEGVSGTLHKNGSVTSRFISESGEADQAANRLVLQGSVQVVANDPKSVLKADRLVYHGERKLIEASGNVSVDAGSYVLGPVPTVWATPDLRSVGTPDQFPSASKRNSKE